METYQFTFIPNTLSATLHSPLSARRRGRQELAENTSMAKSRSPSMDTPKGKNRNEASAHPWTRRVVDSTVTQRELSERKHRGNRSYAPSWQERKHKSLRWSTSGSYWKREEGGLDYDEWDEPTDLRFLWDGFLVLPVVACTGRPSSLPEERLLHLLRGLHHIYFKLDDYLHCVLPNKCFGNIQMIHFYGDYHHSLLKVTHR